MGCPPGPWMNAVRRAAGVSRPVLSRGRFIDETCRVLCSLCRAVCRDGEIESATLRPVSRAAAQEGKPPAGAGLQSPPPAPRPLDAAVDQELLPLAGDQRPAVYFALATLTVSTVSVGPAGGDEIRRRQRPGQKAAAGLDPRVAACAAQPVCAVAVHRGGRHRDEPAQSGDARLGSLVRDEATKRLQLSIRKRAFEHAVRLPLHRVHELKSGRGQRAA